MVGAGVRFIGRLVSSIIVFFIVVDLCNQLACVWFGDGLGPSLFFWVGFNLPSVWLKGWVGSSFLFGLKSRYVG